MFWMFVVVVVVVIVVVVVVVVLTMACYSTIWQRGYTPTGRLQASSAPPWPSQLQNMQFW